MLASMNCDLDQLGSLSRRLAIAVFAIRPELSPSAMMERGVESDGMSVVIRANSPADNEARSVMVWVDEKATPSIGFGPDHTHGSPDEDGIAEVLDILLGVLTDQIVIMEDVGGEAPGFGRWLDLRNADAMDDALTDKYSPGRFLLKSWSGRADREVAL
jgi:hypothetical protein